jgi:hypothetical protein
MKMKKKAESETGKCTTKEEEEVTERKTYHSGHPYSSGASEPNSRLIHFCPVRQGGLRTPAKLGSDGQRDSKEAVDGGHAEAKVVSHFSHDA